MREREWRKQVLNSCLVLVEEEPVRLTFRSVFERVDLNFHQRV